MTASDKMQAVDAPAGRSPGARHNPLSAGQSRLYIVYVRESRLQKYQIKLPKVYESFARATNNYYD